MASRSCGDRRDREDSLRRYFQVPTIAGPFDLAAASRSRSRYSAQGDKAIGADAATAVGGWWAAGLETPADVVALELAIEGGATDAEHLPGHDFVAVDLLKNSLDGGALDVLEIG